MKWLPIYLQEMKYSFDVKVSSSQNENSRYHSNMGMDVGQPDLVFMVRSDDVLHILFLELKTKKGKLRESQKLWNDDFDKNFLSKNATRDVAYGFSEAQEKIKGFLSTLSPLPSA